MHQRHDATATRQAKSSQADPLRSRAGNASGFHLSDIAGRSAGGARLDAYALGVICAKIQIGRKLS
jgi:hypothetical protein